MMWFLWVALSCFLGLIVVMVYQPSKAQEGFLLFMIPLFMQAVLWYEGAFSFVVSMIVAAVFYVVVEGLTNWWHKGGM